jgi:hypothetical protein
MALVYTQDLNTSGTVQTIASGLLVVSVTIRNSTLAIIALTDNRGQTYTTQPGSNHTFDISPSTQFTYQASFQASGGAQIVYSDGPLPNETTSQVIPPGTVPVSGAVSITNATVNVAGNIAVTGSVAITNASIPVTGNVGIIGPVNIGTITGGVTITSGVVNVQNVVNGVLTTNVPPPVVEHFSLSSNTATYTPTRPFSRVLIQPLDDSFARGGMFSVYYTMLAQDATAAFRFLIQDQLLYASSFPGVRALGWEFDEAIPLGATLVVSFTGQGDFYVILL